jgi:hypothetical protein
LADVCGRQWVIDNLVVIVNRFMNSERKPARLIVVWAIFITFPKSRINEIKVQGRSLGQCIEKLGYY